MEIADSEARKGIEKKHGGPFGAVIVKDGKIISKAHNEVLKKNDSTCHAEMLAIKQASKKLKNWNLDGCELYTNCEPCPMCKAAINWAKIKIVYYGCTADDLKEIGFNEKEGNNKGLELIESDRDECKTLLGEYKGKLY